MPVYIARKINMAFLKVGDVGGMLKTSTSNLLQKEFDITPELHHHEKM